MMKPILFNTEMVRAILDGRKTVTRRVVKCSHRDAAGFNIVKNGNGEIVGVMDYDDDERSYEDYTIPPYRSGDILYVRETFRIDYLSNIIGTGRVHYKADGSFADIRFAPNRYDMMRRAQLKPGWRPNENMPREAARIFLRVTDVRVERLQEVTDREAEKEGIGDLFYEEIGFGNKDYGCMAYSDSKGVIGFQKEQFAHLWDSTVKPADRERYGWAANPWVWVIAFEQCEKPEGEK